MGFDEADILILWRGSFAALPPLLALARLLSQSGYRVAALVGGASEEECELVSGLGIALLTAGAPSTGYETPVRKAALALRFRAAAWRQIRTYKRAPLLWVVNAETAIVLGRKLEACRYVLHAYELPESQAKRMLARRYFAGAKAVIAPEGHRAEILQNWYGLREVPTVVPNVTDVPTTAERQPIPDSGIASRMSALSQRTHIALYQGMISRDRDLTGIARALAARLADWSFVIMGRDYGHLREVREVHPGVVHIPYLPPPSHLAVTSWASLGVLVYNHDSLNNRYCAPSKLFEYCAFGLPVLANDVPGLTYSVGRFSAGVCCDTSHLPSTLAALADRIPLRRTPARVAGVACARPVGYECCAGSCGCSRGKLNPTILSFAQQPLADARGSELSRDR